SLSLHDALPIFLVLSCLLLGCPFFHGLPSFLLNVHFLPVVLLLNSILYVAVIVFVFYLIRLISALTLAFYFLIDQVSALTPVFLAFSPLLFFLLSYIFFLPLHNGLLFRQVDIRYMCDTV